jgi:hypothetical protein
MGRISIFQIVACATLFSTALTVNALVIREGGDDRFNTSSAASRLRTASRIETGVVTADGILLGDSAVVRDGVVLGDQSSFCNHVSRFANVRRDRGQFPRDGVVLGDQFVGETSASDIATKR